MSEVWLCPPEIPAGAYMVVYRSFFELNESAEIKFRFSADERAQIFLDGDRIIDGPERGAPERWYYQNGSFTAGAGKHVLTARVICFGFEKWAYGQLSVRHGFFFEDEKKLIGSWECQIVDGCTFEAGYPDWGALPRVHQDSAYNPDILLGQGGIWRPARQVTDERKLFPPDLPLMRYEKVVPQDLGDGLFYFPDYVCAWAVYTFTGSGKVRIRWAETPYQTPEFDDAWLKGVKGRRDGKFFIGNFDTFEVDGRLQWFDYWWHAGHYVQILTEGDVKFEASFFRTGYPYEKFEAANRIEKMAFDTLQACSFETYMDCPYYEQLMYIGDSRLEAICTRLITKDDRLIRKALRMLSLSRRSDGSLNSQYPSHSEQTIPSFMLIWILMLHDHFEVNGRDELTMELLPVAEGLFGFFAGKEENGLLSIGGWNFIDWCDTWDRGTPPGRDCNSMLNLLYVMALQAMADMCGQSSLRSKADELYRLIFATFYDEKSGLLAVDAEKKFFSEHSQVLALLIDRNAPVIDGLRQNELIPCSIYFSYYYMEACRKCGLDDLASLRMKKWEKLADEGLTTFPEEFDNPRSDCHAWSSHILAYCIARRGCCKTCVFLQGC